MFTPTFHDWPRRNKLLLYAVLAMLALALLVLYLYIMPQWRHFQNYQQTIQEKKQRLANSPWPQEAELLQRQFELVEEKLNGNADNDQPGLVQLSETVLQQASATFREKILSQYESPGHFLTTVSRIDYKDTYDRFAQELAERQLALDAAKFGLKEDGQEPVWQMVLKLWTAQLLCQIAAEHHLTLLDEDGAPALNALPPIAYAVTDHDPQPPYLIEFPVRLRLQGHLDDFLRFTQELSSPVRFVPLKQLEISTLPPSPPVPGQTNRVDQAIFNIVCASFFQPSPPDVETAPQ